MIHIPSEEIKQPQLHADTLGFTFVWQGHFLRGVFPQSIDRAKTYFSSGFIDEIVMKGLFPKTWISEYENEQFGIIIEHEMISPILYATDWNSAMLKDAALMVLDIAEVGWKYGYNMVDCHKLNVLFRNNTPLYVDLGSFVPREKGSTGWEPYRGFLESYTYILDMWTHGCEQIAKRMMSPGVYLHSEDYRAWKRPIYRRNKGLLRWKLRIEKQMNAIAIRGEKKENSLKRLLKTIINTVKPATSQSFYCLRRDIERMKVEKESFLKQHMFVFDMDFFDQFNSLACINITDCRLLAALRNKVENVLSLNESNKYSNAEYYTLKNITSVSYPLLNGGILIRDKYPETRFCADAVLVRCDINVKERFAIHNSMVFLNRCIKYSKTGMMYIWIVEPNFSFEEELKSVYSVLRLSEDKTLFLVEEKNKG